MAAQADECVGTGQGLEVGVFRGQRDAGLQAQRFLGRHQRLTSDQTEEVAGGLAPVAAGALAGAALGGYSAWHGGGNAGQVVAGALLGGVSGFYGGLGMWGSSIASGVFSSFVGGGGGRWTLAPVAAK